MSLPPVTPWEVLGSEDLVLEMHLQWGVLEHKGKKKQPVLAEVLLIAQLPRDQLTQQTCC